MAFVSWVFLLVLMLSRSSRHCFRIKCKVPAPRVLITGTNGQLGPELAAHFREKFGKENVLCTSRTIPKGGWAEEGPFEYLDVTDKGEFMKVASNFRATWIVHLAAMLSAVSEKHPDKAIKINMHGTENALDVAASLPGVPRLFIPSSIAAFGPSTPRDNTPDLTVMRPTGLYGIAKVYSELMGDWYSHNRKVDFRSLRYPGIISWKSPPGGGTTDWAIHVYAQALKHGRYENCFVGPDTRMPMMHVDDLLTATTKVLEADPEVLSQRTYNVTGCSFTPREVEAAIRKHISGFSISYRPDFRQAIADSWPRSLDDSIARNDWGWEPNFDLDAISENMLQNIKH